jgi:hypothetical protein
MKLVLAGIFFLALAGFFGWLLGPPLIDDVALRGQKLAVAPDVRIADARCRSKLFVFSLCDMKLQVGGGSGMREVNYFIVDRLGGAQVVAMRSPGPQPVLTTNIGMDHLTNRLVSFAALMLLCGGGGLFAVVQGLRGGGRASA